MDGPLMRVSELDPAAFGRLRELLDAAAEIPAADRERWFEGLPADVQPLVPRLRRLLAHEADAGGFGTMPRIDLAPPPAPAAADTPPEIGPYRALRLLGEGGMGRVWLAERTDIMQGRPVALKLPRAPWRHAGLAERMAREREILAVLDHPHIARLYDAGIAADGQPYLALEYVEGERIDEYCRTHALPVRARLQLFLQVARAVAHAHAKLVVHRDLKPGNILVTAAGEVRLLDFGIAKLIDPSSAEPGLTAEAGRVMTPDYAAPEQILGQPVGTATDIYALGVVLHELLTGARPYKLERSSAAALEEAILRQPPVRPSACVRDRRLARQLRGDLDTIVATAMKKSPAERYATASHLADDVERWLNDLPLHARPDRAGYRLWKFVQRNKLPVAAVAGIVLALGIGLAAALWQGAQVRREAAKANAIKDFLVGLFEASDVEQSDARKRREQSVQQLLENSATALETGLADQPQTRGELQRIVGRLLQDLELAEPAARLRAQRVEWLDRSGAPPGERAAARHELAESQQARGAWDESRRTLERARADCAAGGRADRLACLRIEIDLARVDFAERRIDAALARAEPAIAALQQIEGAEADRADALEMMGLLRASKNEPEAAHDLFARSLALRRAIGGERSVHVADARFRIGRNLWALRHLREAQREFEGALAIFREALGPEHVRTALIELNLGRLVFYVGVQPDGLDKIRHAAQVFTGRAAELNPDSVYEARFALANALLLDGRLDEADRRIEEALADRAGLGQAAMADPALDQSKARWLLDTGRYAEARAWLEALRRRTAAAYGDRHPETADRTLRLVQVAIAEGRLDDAEQAIAQVRASHDAREAAFGSVKHRAELAYVNLLIERGRAAEARPIIEAQLAAAGRTPREEQFRDVLVQVHDAAARTYAGLGDLPRAAEQFGQAIALMAAGYPDHPHLAALRARLAQVLVARRDFDGARREIARAEAAFAAQPLAGAHLRRPLAEAQARLAAAQAARREAADRVAAMAGSAPRIAFSPVSLPFSTPSRLP